MAITMSRTRPPFFDRIQQQSRERWSLLDQYPDLAAPWHQLFRQVQSPRHVLSELLQNADDAGATWAGVRLTEDGVFVFEHDGQDFDEESLRSLCQFGLSNKRRLHTIGFRGLGFKSTFSYGPRVEVHTPTLAFAFTYRRFTEPLWVESAPPADRISIRIPVLEPEIQERIREDLARWSESAVPLLFFRSVRRLEIQGTVIQKEVEGPGPVPRSEWVRLVGPKCHRVLRIWSGDEAFPAEALEEVRRERDTPDFSLPPCQVEIILGLEGEQRLYAILPIEVRPRVPFSCNAPFLQDPARTGIKDPAASPTNRWLLRRIGQVAGEALLGWIGNTDLDPSTRAQGYQLIPKSSIGFGSLDQTSTREILNGFTEHVRGRPVLLTHEGELAAREECLVTPPEVTDVWNPEQTLALFGGGRKRTVLAREVNATFRERLDEWGWLERFSAQAVFETLFEVRPPRPANPEALAALWAFVQEHSNDRIFMRRKLQQLAVMPVVGNEYLFPASEVLNLTDRDERLTPDDWAFLERKVRAYDPFVDEFLASRPADAPPVARWAAASQLRRALFRDQDTSLQQVLDHAAEVIFAAPDPGEDGIRLARIAARADAVVSSGFSYFCRDGSWRPVSEGLLSGLDPAVEELLPAEWLISRVIHPDYERSEYGADLRRWREWVASPCSRLHSFPLPVTLKQNYWDVRRAMHFIREHGGVPPAENELPYRSNTFNSQDADFDDTLWKHWSQLSTDNPGVWTTLVSAIGRSWNEHWRALSRAVLHQRSNRREQLVQCAPLPAQWLHRLQNLPCLPGAFGQLHYPAELLRANENTDPLRGVEPFLRDDLDRPEFAELLDLLGVRSRPGSVEKLVQRIRQLTTILEPPVEGLRNLYLALDRTVNHLLPGERTRVIQLFQNEPLIRSDGGEWLRANSVYQRNEEDFPGVPLVHRSVSGLGLWDVLGVPPRPTLEHAFQWLCSLAPDTPLEGSERDRARSLLRREPHRVVTACGAWLDLTSRWTKLDALRWKSQTRQAEVKLSLTVRRRTADLSMLDGDGSDLAVFRALPELEKHVEQRVQRVEPSRSDLKPGWIGALAECLCRLPDAPDAASDRAEQIRQNRREAFRLLRSRWCPVTRLEVVPYVENEPAGDAYSPRALWLDRTLYVQGNEAYHHRSLVDVLASQFVGDDVRRAIRDCVGREVGFVNSYMGEHFALLPEPIYDDTGDEPPVEAGERPLTGSLEAGISPSDGTPGATHVGLEVYPDRHTPDLEGSEATGQPEDPSPVATLRRTNSGQGRRDRLGEYLGRQGFRWSVSRDLFVDEHGNTVRRQEGVFPWARYNPAGVETGRFWIGGRSLGNGVEVPAEVWESLKQAPHIAHLLLPADEPDQGGYVDYSGVELLRERDRGRLELFTAEYRLRRQ